MRRLALAATLCGALFLAGCASFDAKPHSAAELVEMAKSGQTAQQIIEELHRTGTVLPLAASDYVRLANEGVPPEVLDYLQRAQIDDLRWRDRFFYGGGWGPCPWGRPSGFMGPTRRGAWGC